MGRPRTPIGTFGEIHFEKTPSGQVRARARYRDDDGQVRRVSAVGSTQKTAERNLKEQLGNRTSRAPHDSCTRRGQPRPDRCPDPAQATLDPAGALRPPRPSPRHDIPPRPRALTGRPLYWVGLCSSRPRPKRRSNAGRLCATTRSAFGVDSNDLGRDSDNVRGGHREPFLRGCDGVNVLRNLDQHLLAGGLAGAVAVTSGGCHGDPHRKGA